MLLVVVAIVGAIVWSAVDKSGVILRNQTAASSENYTIDGTMMSVYFNGNIQSYNYNAMYYAYMYYQSLSSTYSWDELYQAMLGYDPSVSLKKQNRSNDQGTWYEYFEAQTKNSVERMLVYCEAAKAAGVELDAEDLKALDEAVEDLRSSAKQANKSLNSYISSVYGTGVKESDYRAAYKLELLANKYSEMVNDDLDKLITDERVNEFYLKNPTEYSMIDVYSYESKVSTDELKDAVAKLEEASDTESFLTAFRAYLELEQGANEPKTEAEEDHDHSEDAAEDDNKEEKIDKLIEDAKKTIRYYSTTDNYFKWMMGDTWGGKEENKPTGSPDVGRTLVVIDGTKATIMHIVSAPTKDTHLVHQNVSYLAVGEVPEGTDKTLEEYANGLLESFKDGEHTADALKALGEKYYKTNASYTSGSIGVSDVDNWIAEAKVGDYTLIKAQVDSTEKDADGKAIKVDTYFLVLINDGEESWYHECHEQILNDDNTAWYEEHQKNVKVTFNEKLCDNLD